METLITLTIGFLIGYWVADNYFRQKISDSCMFIVGGVRQALVSSRETSPNKKDFDIITSGLAHLTRSAPYMRKKEDYQHVVAFMNDTSNCQLFWFFDETKQSQKTSKKIR